MTEVKRTSSGSSGADIPVVLIGHDRGARVSHRLAVSGVEGVDILGVCLIDIVSIGSSPMTNRCSRLMISIGSNIDTMATLRIAVNSRKGSDWLLSLAATR